MKHKASRIFRRFHPHSLSTYLLCSLILIACGQEQGSWTAVQQEGKFIFGVWHSATAKIAEQAMSDVAANIKGTAATEGEASAADQVLQTTVPPEQLLPSNGELLGWGPGTSAFYLRR